LQNAHLIVDDNLFIPQYLYKKSGGVGTSLHQDGQATNGCWSKFSAKFYILVST
jgi:hypothetical protein